MGIRVVCRHGAACLCLSAVLWANDETPVALVDIENDSSCYFNGVVNVISGSYFESDTDLYIAGPEPLVLQRSYSSGTPTGPIHGWIHNYNSKAFGGKTPKDTVEAIITEPSGAQILYDKVLNAPGSETTLLGFDPMLDGRGVTNTAGGEISGRTNIKNNTIEFLPGKERIKAHLGSGGYRILSRPTWLPEDRRPRGNYFVIDEYRPNGNHIHYQHDPHSNVNIIWAKARRQKPKSCHTKEKGKPGDKKKKRTSDILASIGFVRPDDISDHPDIFVSGSNGHRVAYHFHVMHAKGQDHQVYLSRVDRTDGPPISYTYRANDDWRAQKLQSRRLPDERFLSLDYYDQGRNDVAGTSVYIASGDHRQNRVKTLYAPVGTDTTPIVTGKFFYTLSNDDSGYTDAYDALGVRTRYHYDSGLRIGLIQHYGKDADGQEILLLNEGMTWGQGSNYGNMVAKWIDDGKGHVHHYSTYSYDAAGNVLVDSLYGNLTGENVQTPLHVNGCLQPNGAECYQKRTTYSQDGYNLVTREEYLNGKVVRYRYEPGTDLVVAKFICAGNRILLREFTEYDDTAVATKKIIDDGSTDDVQNLNDVTERHITITTPRTSEPIGFPEEVQEKYVDLSTGEEKQLSRKTYTYSNEGYLLTETVYDADDVFCYTLEKAYNGLGNVIYEKDALGQEIRRTYDANGNKISEEGPRQGIVKGYTYDFMNRLIMEDVTDGNDKLCEHHRYDYLGNKVGSTDFFGNETLFSYDALHRCTAVEYPAVADAHGMLAVPRETRVYDIAGNVVCAVDAEGDKTETSYNVRGQPIEIRYPDGTRESLRYDLDGLLVKKVDKNGAVTKREYDVLGRCTKEEVFSSDGELFSQITHRHNALHLVESTDREGHVTHFSYDNAGRLIREEKGYETKSYHYDALGRKDKTTLGSGSEATVQVVTYDFLNRVVEERTETANGDVQSLVEYAYDGGGNRIKVVEHRGDTLAITTTTYNVDNQPCVVTDPEGYKTVTEYHYNTRSALGQTVLRVYKTDPQGQRTVSDMDTHGHVTLLETYDPTGTLLAKKEFRYNRRGLRLAVVDTVFAHGDAEKTITTEWQYGPRGRVEAFLEAVGTPEQKITYTAYDACGRKSATIKPDGVKVECLYDPIGRLKRHVSSDGTLDTTFFYNHNDQPVEVVDAIRHETGERGYDVCGRLVEDLLPNGLMMTFSYDSQGRSKSLGLPDGSQVLYRYDGAHMTEVVRVDAAGQETYRHRYTEYDLGGKVTKMQGVKDAGAVTFSYDVLGRLRKMETATFSEEIPEGGFDAVGNLLMRHYRDPMGEVSCHYSYDALYQLSSEEGTATHAYVHDSLYNRRQKDEKGHTLNALNQILDDGVTAYGYDKNGNLLEDGKATYAYDALNRLVAVKGSAQEVEYQYDIFNRRMCRRCGDETVRYLYDGDNEIGSVDESGDIVELRILGVGHGAEIGAAVAMELRGRLLVPLCDHRGDITVVVDEKGLPVATYRYTAYGEEMCDGEVASPWRFQSKRVDEETGFVFFGRRYYSPLLGRWTTQDPAGYDAGPNLYAYVSNEPLTLSDPYGLFSFCSTSFLFGQSPFAMPLLWRPQAMSLGTDASARQNLAQKQRAAGLHYRSETFGYGEADPNLRISFGNGVSNNLRDATHNSKWLSKVYGGNNVHLFYDPSHLAGFADVFDVVKGYFGFETLEARGMANHWQSLLGEMGPQGRVDHYAHSEDATIVHYALSHLSEENKRKIHVINLGGSWILERGECNHPKNYVSDFDLVPQIQGCLAGFLSQGERIEGTVNPKADVKWLRSRVCVPGFDHAFRGPTYRKVMEENGREFIKKHGRLHRMDEDAQ